jgi:hypothetical protein
MIRRLETASAVPSSSSLPGHHANPVGLEFLEGETGLDDDVPQNY